MLNIDSKIYQENLLLTQAYCQLQVARTDKNSAAILRSFNPVYNEKHIFSFEPVGHYFIAKWLIIPWQTNDDIYAELFKKQLTHKKTVIKYIGPNLKAEGRILIAQVDVTVVDGASEAESEGFIDINDCPPIDTWFYLASNNNTRLLFCWIPQQFVELVTLGIEVNCLDCFYWDDEDHRARKNGTSIESVDANTSIKSWAFNPKALWHKLKKIFPA